METYFQERTEGGKIAPGPDAGNRGSARKNALKRAFLAGLTAGLIALMGGGLSGEPAQARIERGARGNQATAAFTVSLPILLVDWDPDPSIFSIQLYDHTGMSYVADAGARIARIPLHWNLIEPSNTTPDLYNWAVADALMEQASINGVYPLITIADSPDWATIVPKGPIRDLNEFQQFIRAAANRYPQVKYWEFYNEPDNIYNWGYHPDDYAAMLQTAYPVIKSASPTAQVFFGGLALDWFEEDDGVFNSHFLHDVLVNCTGPCFDVGNFHYYPYFRSKWEAYGPDLIGKVKIFREAMAAVGYDRPIAITEVGWPSGSVWGSPELQARYVPKVYVRSLVAGVEFSNWYALIDADTSNPGLLDQDKIPRPAYTAFQTVSSLLARAQYKGALSFPPLASGRIEGYQFSIPKGASRQRLDVYWYDCYSLAMAGSLPEDCSDSAPLTINASSAVIIDKMGNRAILSDGSDGTIDGKIALSSISSSPIFVEYK